MNQNAYDTTVNIFEYYFKVRIPYLQSRSIEELRKNGVRLSDVKEIDNDIANQWLTTMMPISTMIDYYKKDIPVKVIKYEDIKLIYRYISEHIHAWKARLERGVNLGNAPIDDLIAMDQFANIIYDHAKYQISPDVIHSLLAQKIIALQKINATNFFRPELVNKLRNLNSSNVDIDEQGGIIRINHTEEQYKERDSLSEFFENKLLANRRL